MRSPLLAAALALTACVVPRSMTLGQMAAPVGRGAAEVGVFGGVLYASQLNPPYTTNTPAGDGITHQDRHAVVSAPMGEANVQYGFNDHFAFNAHASSAGFQPGLKVTLNRSRVAHVALLPAVGLGYASHAQSTDSTDSEGLLSEENPGWVTSFTFLAGLKLLVSHRSGFFAGVGYDFLFNRSVNVVEATVTSSRSEAATHTLAHQLSASVGFDIALGLLHLRPEIAFAVYPGVSTSLTTLADPTEKLVSGGWSWALFPGFTLAVASPPRKLTAEEEDEERAKVKQKHRSADDDDDEEDTEDDDGAPSRKRHRDDD